MFCRLSALKPTASLVQSTLKTLPLRPNGIIFRQFQRDSRQTINSRMRTAKAPTLKERLMAPAGPNGMNYYANQHFSRMFSFVIKPDGLLVFTPVVQQPSESAAAPWLVVRPWVWVPSASMALAWDTAQTPSRTPCCGPNTCAIGSIRHTCISAAPSASRRWRQPLSIGRPPS